MLSLAPPRLRCLEVLNLAGKLLYLLPCVGAFVCARLRHHLELLLQIRDLVCLKEMLKSKYVCMYVCMYVYIYIYIYNAQE
jgi:hypothetical protein